MHSETGIIYTPEQMAALRAQLRGLPDGPKKLAKFVNMQIAPTTAQLKRKPPRVGRNDPCPCGSGKKFKQCCWSGSARPPAKAKEKK